MGVISLTTQGHAGFSGRPPLLKVVQNLSVFVVEILNEGFVVASEPSYILLQRAALTVQGVLQQIYSDERQSVAERDGHADDAQHTDSVSVSEFTSLESMMQTESWGYDLEFWRLLGEPHSTIE